MGRRERDAEAELNLPPGFRFHPTDEELVVHYLCRKVAHHCIPVPIIAEVDLYKFDPWELPEKALFGEREWYFFTPRDRKYPNGSRPNRAAGHGYWKATGADKPVSPQGTARSLGIKKALVFYSGKAPRGVKTDWIMHEYRLSADPTRPSNKKGGNLRLDDWVLCRLYNKKNNWQKPRLRQEATAMDDTASESIRTQDSDIEDVFADFGDLGELGRASNGCKVEPQQMEDSEWYTDLNLDDLQSPFLPFGSTMSSTAVAFDASIPDFYFPAL